MIKVINISLALSLFVAGAAHAAEGVYIGVDYAFDNDTELEAFGTSISRTNDAGFNLLGGYVFDMADGFQIGVEAEYRTFGDATYLNDMQGSGNAFYLNAKPMYFFTQNIYVAGVLGLGQMELELTDLVTNETFSDSDTSFQFGVEGGYVFNNGLGVSAGYRSANADIDGVDVTTSGFFAGVRYKF